METQILDLKGTIDNKYINSYGNVDWYNRSYELKEYTITGATVSQLRKLKVPTAKAVTNFNNNYKNYGLL